MPLPERPRVLIVGCGDVGTRVAVLLSMRLVVYALARRPESAEALRRAGLKPVIGDLDDRKTLRRLSGLADWILHLAPPPGSGVSDARTKRLLAALGRRNLPRRIGYISTSGVYGDCAGAVVDETRPPRPQTARARRRLDAETRLRDFGCRTACTVSILRVPGIYGSDRLPVERIRRGTPALRREDDVYTNHIHADDLARALVAALFRGRSNRIYNAADGYHTRMGDWFDLVADTFALPRPPRLPRPRAMEQLSPALLSFMSESRRLDNTRLVRELRLRLRYPDVRAALAALRPPL